MESKQFEFHGFEFKKVVGSAVAASFIGLAAAFAIGYFIIFINHPMFIAVIVMLVAFPLTALYGKYFKSFWKVIIDEKKVEIYRDGNLTADFALSEIRKIKVNGWFRWKLEDAARMIEEESERKSDDRPPFNVWQTRNPYLIFQHLKKAYKNSGRDDERSHRSVTIITDNQKISMMLGNLEVINGSGKRDLLMFDRFLLTLEQYAVKQKYEKTDRTYSLSPPFVKKYYYLRK